MPGTIGVFAIDSTTGKQSNAVTETITPGTCVTPTPGIRVSPSPFDFGTVNVGSTAQETFTIQNTGTATLTVTGVNISDKRLDRKRLTNASLRGELSVVGDTASAP